MIRTYKELIKLSSFEERYQYLKLDSQVGVSTFGFDRILNQNFYTSLEWKRIRRIVIVRDNGMDLGLPGYPIFGKALIHHLNPITPSQIRYLDLSILDPNFLILVSMRTHHDIHYGKRPSIDEKPVVRRPNDTKLW